MLDPRLNFVNVIADIRREQATQATRDDNATIERAVVIEERREREADETRLRDEYIPVRYPHIKQNRGLTTEYGGVQ